MSGAIIDAARLKRRAAKWLADETERAQRAHGARWVEHQAWVMDYLLAELRQRVRRFVKVRNG